MKTGCVLLALGTALIVSLFLIYRSAFAIQHGLCRSLETRHGNYSPDGQRDADLDIAACTKSGRRVVIRVHGYDDGCEVAQISGVRPFEARWSGRRELTVTLGRSRHYRRLADRCGDVTVKFAAMGGR